MVDIRGGDLRHLGDDEDPYDVLTEYQNIQRLFKERSINGISIDIREESPSRWAPPSGNTFYRIPNSGNEPTKFAVAQASIDAYDWVKLQSSTSPAGPVYRHQIDAWVETYKEEYRDTDKSMAQAGHPWLNEAYLPTVRQMEQSPDTAPMPVLEIDSSYEVTTQEGRSRGVGAVAAGVSYIPIWIAARRDRH